MFDHDLEYFLNLWQEEEQVTNQINTLLDGGAFVMFFKKGDMVYGAGEDSRLTYAKMKHPDEEVNQDWVKEANFLGVNLTKALKGDKVHNIFSSKDLKDIKVIDKEEAEELLAKQATGKLSSPAPKEPEDGQPVGSIQLKDKAK